MDVYLRNAEDISLPVLRSLLMILLLCFHKKLSWTYKPSRLISETTMVGVSRQSHCGNNILIVKIMVNHKDILEFTLNEIT
jgi:hypothetical protein